VCGPASMASRMVSRMALPMRPAPGMLRNIPSNQGHPGV
jgi:hypothetical protein